MGVDFQCYVSRLCLSAVLPCRLAQSKAKVHGTARSVSLDVCVLVASKQNRRRFVLKASCLVFDKFCQNKRDICEAFPCMLRTLFFGWRLGFVFCFAKTKQTKEQKTQRASRSGPC